MHSETLVIWKWNESGVSVVYSDERLQTEEHVKSKQNVRGILDFGLTQSSWLQSS